MVGLDDQYGVFSVIGPEVVKGAGPQQEFTCYVVSVWRFLEIDGFSDFRLQPSHLHLREGNFGQLR
jgi:hypothetical protein